MIVDDLRSSPAAELGSGGAPAESLVGDSMSGAGWTAVSRVTGFVRAAAVAGALGATYFGNTFQALNSLPNLVFYQLLAGSLFASVLVPALAVHLERGDDRRAREVLGGFLGTMLVGAACAAGLLLLGGLCIVQVMASGVPDPAIAAAQRHAGSILLCLFVPQVMLYVVAGVGAASMNAKRRFGLAAGAPALENVALIALVVIAAATFGSGTDLTTVTDTELLVLGLGATLAVGCHAALQWWGARRAGLTMRVRRGWRDDEVRGVLARMIPALGYSGLAFAQALIFVVAANRVPGGVVALQLSLNFFYLPLALFAWPVARALLPQLAHRLAQGTSDLFVGDLRQAVALSSFFAIPVAVVYVTLSFPLARVVAFGRLGPEGAHLLGWSIAAIGPGVLAETWFILGTYACYATGETRRPLRPMALRVSVSIALLALALQVSGSRFIPLLGLAMSFGSLAGAMYLYVVVTRTVSQLGTDAGTGRASLRRSLSRSLVASLLMAGPAWLAADLVQAQVDGKVGQVLAMAAAVAVGGLVFVGAHLLLGSPELRSLRANLVGRRVPAKQGVAT